MLQASSSIIINAPPERVFQLLAQPELLSRRMKSVKSFKVISRGAGSMLTETTAGTDGRDTMFTLELRLLPPFRMEFHQIKGELRSLEGADVLESEDGATRITEAISFDVGIPLFGDLLGRAGIRQVIQRQIEERLAVLKELAEESWKR